MFHLRRRIMWIRNIFRVICNWSHRFCICTLGFVSLKILCTWIQLPNLSQMQQWWSKSRPWQIVNNLVWFIHRYNLDINSKSIWTRCGKSRYNSRFDSNFLKSCLNLLPHFDMFHLRRRIMWIRNIFRVNSHRSHRFFIYTLGFVSLKILCTWILLLNLS